MHPTASITNLLHHDLVGVELRDLRLVHLGQDLHSEFGLSDVLDGLLDVTLLDLLQLLLLIRKRCERGVKMTGSRSTSSMVLIRII